MESNLEVKSNLMIVKTSDRLADSRYSGYPSESDVLYYPHKFLPGDLVRLVYPDKCDVRVISRYLTERQIHEVQEYMVCRLCGRTCAGTCVTE